jgi:hypothetical protein
MHGSMSMKLYLVLSLLQTYNAKTAVFIRVSRDSIPQWGAQYPGRIVKLSLRKLLDATHN